MEIGGYFGINLKNRETLPILMWRVSLAGEGEAYSPNRTRLPPLIEPTTIT